MIRRPMLLTAAAVTLALGACSGGGDSDPTPTPSPTTSPSPSPTASPTYPALPLTANTEFFTISASTSYTGDPTAGAVVLGAAGTEGRSDRVRLAISSDFATGTYVIREATAESRFTDDNIVTGSAPDPANREYVFRSTSTASGSAAGNFAQAEFLNNTIKDKVTTDTGLNLTRTSYAAWWRGDSTAGQKRITYTNFGYATASSDLPTASATYTARIVGRVIQVAGAATTLARVSGTATITVNFATGLVDTTLNVSTVGAGGATTPYGTFTGQGAIAVGANQFNGSFASGSPIPGTFAGGFYGSQGAEIGITFAGLGTVGAADTRLVGVIVGKKN